MRLLGLLLWLGFAGSLWAQGPLTSNLYNYHIIDRHEMLSDHLNRGLFTSVKPMRRDLMLTYVDPLEAYSSVDEFNGQYLYIDNAEYAINQDLIQGKPVLKSFYKHKNALYQIKYGDSKGILQFTINPIIAVEAGTDQGDSLSSYRNSRGLVLRGSIGNKVGFFTKAVENQFRFPNYIREQVDREKVVTGAGLYKPFGKDGVDFFDVSGYITFSPIKEIMVQFGHDRNFIGNGYRSLILSDDAKPYPFLKLTTRVWKINYTNLFMEHVDFQHVNNGNSLKRKFSAFHHFSINLGKNLNIGLFENIIFDRQDSLENNRYDIQYLNPIIFYRAIEHGLNSTDNAMLGLDWKWNFLQHFSFYGQFVFDEFVKNEFVKFTDDWRNKWAYQAGLKYINVAGVSNLDFQIEANQVRPFVYTHKFSSQNWAHYNQELAHPLGANFRELLAIVRYQALNRLNLTLFISQSKQGLDSSYQTNRFGANVLLNNRDVLDRDKAPQFQGVQQNIQTVAFNASYMLYHNLFLDASVMYRSREHELLGTQDNLLFSIGLRLNAQRAKIY